MKELKGFKWESIFSSFLFIIVGIVLLFSPETTARTICYLIGMVGIAIGIFRIVTYFTTSFEKNYEKNNLVNGLVAVLLGLFVILKVKLIISLIPFLLGILVTISGIGKLQASLDIKRLKSEKWLGVFIVSLVNIGLGILLLFRPFSAATTMFMIIGACMIFSGVTDLVNVLYISKKFKDYMKDMEALDQDIEED